MHNLDTDQIEAVAGGVLPLVAALAFVYYEREHIGDFFEGAFEGYDKNQAEHKK